MAKLPKADWGKLDEVVYGCANQAGEDNRNVARMALLLAGPAVLDARLDRESAVRLGPRRGRARRARHSRGRSGFHHRGRRRIDVARAFRHGQGRGGLPARGRDLRHDHRLALRQSEDAGDIRYRFHAAKPARTSPSPSRSRAPTRTHSPCAAKSAPPRPRRAASSTMRSSRSTCRPDAARPVSVAKDEHPRAGTTLEELAKLRPHRAQGRRGDRGQCVGRQ